MWSDTGSNIYNSKGDIIRKVHLDGYNLTGPVKGSRHLEVSTMKIPDQHYSLRTDRTTPALSRK